MLAIIGIMISVVVFPMIGIHKEVGAGKQAGYISAVEKSGLFWKTGTAYVKPELSSTQEDVYCVDDDEVYAQLEKAAADRTRVEVSHISWLSAGITHCNGEPAVIKSVKNL